jgi:hypothetical protein
MSKALFTLLAFTVVTRAAVVSGCSGGTTEADNTTLVYGHVYLNGRAVGSATVVAMGIDNTFWQSTVTNDSGAYALELDPGVERYNLTAVCLDAQQTTGTLYRKGLRANEHDIHITMDMSRKSIIKGMKSGVWNATHISITATRVDDGRTITADADENGNFTLYVDRGVTYSLSGSFLPDWGLASGIGFWYHNDSYLKEIILEPGQTVLLDYQTYAVHPPTVFPTAH